jgi:hypothetical protein
VRSDGDYRQGQTNLDRKDLIMIFGKEAAKPSPKSPGNIPATVLPPVKVRQGRERLSHFDSQIDSAKNAISELTEHCARLQDILVDADNASRELQEHISSDGGASLSLYSKGDAEPNDRISILVRRERSTNEAAAAATVGLPATQQLLASASQQLVTLQNERHAEVGRVVSTIANSEVQEYERHFEKTCLLLDSLIGFSRVGQSNIGDVYRIEEQPRMPKIVASGDSTADPFIRHTTNERVVEQSAQRWAAIRSALERDANADISDLERTTK